MKIIHVLPCFGRAGGERLMIELANREAAAGHEVTVVAGYHIAKEETLGGLDPEIAVRFVTNKPVSGAARYLPLLGWLWREREWISRKDVLHCHLTYGAVFGSAVQLIAWITRTRRPVVVETYHAVGMPIPKLHKWVHARMAVRRDAISFMVAEASWGALTQRHPRLISRIIPVGVPEPDVERISPQRRAEYRAELGIPANASLVVGTISRFFVERQTHRYIAIFAQIAKELGPGIHFVIGGFGPERQRIKDDIAAYGLKEQVHLPGVIKEIERPLAIMDLYITSNVGTVPGVAGLQAVGAGLPVIGLQLLDTHEASPSTWIWSSVREDEVAQRAIELLVATDRRRELAETQRAYLRAHHSPHAMAESYEALYSEAIAKRA